LIGHLALFCSTILHFWFNFCWAILHFFARPAAVLFCRVCTHVHSMGPAPLHIADVVRVVNAVHSCYWHSIPIYMRSCAYFWRWLILRVNLFDVVSNNFKFYASIFVQCCYNFLPPCSRISSPTERTSVSQSVSLCYCIASHQPTSTSATAALSAAHSLCNPTHAVLTRIQKGLCGFGF
jgi:hypothetical protein